MFPAFLTTLLWSFCVVAARRSVAQLGEFSANFWRLLLAVFVLGLLAHSLGGGVSGSAVGWFVLSGLIGFGLGDIGVFGALSRIGSRLTVLMAQCLAAPIAGFAEWWWLGTTLSALQIIAISIVLSGIIYALLPDSGLRVHRPGFAIGLLFGLLAALGQGLGAVLSRKGYLTAEAAGEMVASGVADSILLGATTGYQRLLGGIGLVAAFYIGSLCSRHLRRPPDPAHAQDSAVSKTTFVTLNALSGPIIGIICFQWALATTPSAIVQPIVAMTPLVVIPFAYWFEGDKPTRRQLTGALLSVLGVIGLAAA